MSNFLLLWGDAVGSRCSLWILCAAQELNRLRSRSVSRRSVPAGSAVDGSPSRMRSRSAHREQDLQSRVSQAAARFLHHLITNDCFHSALWKQRGRALSENVCNSGYLYACLMHWRLYWNAAWSLDMKMLLDSHSKELVTNVESMDVLDSPLPIPHYILGKWCSNTFSGLYVRIGSDKWLSKDFTADLSETWQQGSEKPVKWNGM